MRNKIKLEALDLPLGNTTYSISCPVCGQAGSFSVTRIRDGLLYNCFRASCSCRGFIPSVASSTYNERELVPKKAKEFKGELSPLSGAICNYLQESYEIDKDVAEANGWKWDSTNERLYMPTHNIFGTSTGAVCKKLPWSLYEGPKAVNYPAGNIDVGLHFPAYCEFSGDRVVVVEDIISSVKVSMIENCCALLGTNMNEGQASLLATQFNSVVFMLDPDAQNKSVSMARKYGAMFKEARAIALDDDPKDAALDKLREALVG
jgi:hypothetical protein